MVRKIFLYSLIAMCVVALTPHGLFADEVLLTDGSRLVGHVKTLADGKVTIETDFAGSLEIEVAKVRGISSEGPLTVQLDSGDRVVGQLSFTPDGGQRVTGPGLGGIPIQVQQVTAVWAPDGDSPEVAALKATLTELENPWSARLQLGLDGQTGNTDRTAINGRMEIRREIDTERLLIYAQGRSSRENGNDTVKEVLGGLKLEVDVKDKWFLFGRTELEFDKFENLDLRTTISGGVGYSVIDEPKETFKLRLGVGFEHESFSTGTSEDQAIAEAGWDYRKELADGVIFTHAVTVHPAFEDIEDYRAVMDNALEFPFKANENWKLQLGMRNDYNAMPEPGIDRLDTYYYLNIALDWK